jgi:hypothetical protein
VVPALHAVGTASHVSVHEAASAPHAIEHAPAAGGVVQSSSHAAPPEQSATATVDDTALVVHADWL